MQSVRIVLLLVGACFLMGGDCVGEPGDGGDVGGLDGVWTQGGWSLEQGPDSGEGDEPDWIPPQWLCPDCGNPDCCGMPNGATRLSPLTSTGEYSATHYTWDELEAYLWIALMGSELPISQVVVHDILTLWMIKMDEQGIGIYVMPEHVLDTWNNLGHGLLYLLTFDEPNMDRVHGVLADMWLIQREP